MTAWLLIQLQLIQLSNQTINWEKWKPLDVSPAAFSFYARHQVLFLIHPRHKSIPSPHFVAKTSPCRNNSHNNLANFLESARNPRIFASVKVHTLVIVWVSFLIVVFAICFRLLVNVSNDQDKVRRDANLIFFSDLLFCCHQTNNLLTTNLLRVVTTNCMESNGIIWQKLNMIWEFLATFGKTSCWSKRKSRVKLGV